MYLKKVQRKWLLIFIGFLGILCFFYFQNNAIGITKLTTSFSNLPPSFHQYKIVHLTDLHNKTFGNKQKTLVKKVANEKPDMIVFTGDLIDQKKGGEGNSLVLMSELVKLAPVYFVTGNHDWVSGDFSKLEKELESIGVHVLRNTIKTMDEGHETIQLVGIDDPISGNDPEKAINQALEGNEGEEFTILLSHRPELFHLYTDYPFDLVFSGHAHGGQFRIPFIGGLVAPNQGFFPKYTSGKHTENNTTMIVSRGLGNSIIPLRIFNRPELMVVTLERNK